MAYPAPGGTMLPRQSNALLGTPGGPPVRLPSQEAIDPTGMESVGNSMGRLGLDVATRAAHPSGYGAGPSNDEYYRSDSYATRKAALNGLMGLFGPTPNLGTTAPNVAAGVAPVSYDVPGLEAARNASYASAKDRAGKTARSALSSMAGELQARGMGGAGYEAGDIGNILARDANTIGESDRAQAESEVAAEQHAADVNYQGGIAQRGQNISAAEQAASRDQQAKLAAAELAQQRTIALTSLLSNAMGRLY